MLSFLFVNTFPEIYIFFIILPCCGFFTLSLRPSPFSLRLFYPLPYYNKPILQFLLTKESSMREEVKDILYDGEKILWEGKAEPFELLEPPFKNSIILTWCISAVVVIAFLVLYIPFHIRSGGKMAQFVISFVLVCMIPFVLSIRPITTRNALRKKITYLFTTERAICVNDNQINAFVICKDTPCKLETLPGGSSVIYMGEGAMKIKSKGSRDASVFCIKNSDSEDLTGMVFYGVKDAKAICKNFAPFSSVIEA